MRFASTQASQSRIARLEARLPAFLRRFTTPLRTAPVSHITAFAILHELTAIVPIIGLTAAFHYFDWLPPWFVEGAMVKKGIDMWGGYLRRKGWIDDGATPGADAKEGKIAGRAKGKGSKWFGRGENGVRIVVELATAYAVTKFLLPVRIIVSVWATPAFARWTVVPVVALAKRMMGFGGAAVASVARLSPAAGTNAVGGRALPVIGGKVK